MVLDGDEGRHATVVRRIRAGERVDLTDGAGKLARCVVVDAERSVLTCDVEAHYDVPEPSPRIVVVQALPKGDRGEAAVETLTEVGVDEIVPWSAARCVTRWKGERGDKALRKWRSTAREAAKQSRRAWLPEVSEPVKTTDRLVTRLATADLGVVLHEEADQPLAELDVPGGGQRGGKGGDEPEGGEIVVVVGPEGGVAPDELDAFVSAGAVPARLGPTVLRTSTAGTVASGVLLSHTPRWA